MRTPLLFFCWAICTLAATGQSVSLHPGDQRSTYFQIEFGILNGHTPLYLLEGEVSSVSGVNQVGIGVHYQSDLSSAMYVKLGFKTYNLAADYDLVSARNNHENIISSSRYIAIPVSLGTIKMINALRVELSAGLEWANLVAHRETIVNTSRFLVLDEQSVDLNNPLVQRTNWQILAALGLSTPISDRWATYLGIQGNLGLSDLDTSSITQQLTRMELSLGIRYQIR